MRSTLAQWAQQERGANHSVLGFLSLVLDFVPQFLACFVRSLCLYNVSVWGGCGYLVFIVARDRKNICSVCL